MKSRRRNERARVIQRESASTSPGGGGGGLIAIPERWSRWPHGPTHQVFGASSCTTTAKRSLRTLISELWRPCARAPPNTTLASRPFASLTFAVNYALTRHRFEMRAPREPPGPSGDPFYSVPPLHIAAGIVLFGVIRPARPNRAVHQRGSGLAGPSAQHRDASSRSWRFSTSPRSITDGPGMDHRRRRRLMPWHGDQGNHGDRAHGSGNVVGRLAAGFPPSLVGSRLLAGLASTGDRALVSTGARSESVGFAVGGWTTCVRRSHPSLPPTRVRAHPLVFEYAWLPALSWSEVLPEATFLVVLSGRLKRMPMALIPRCVFVLAPSSSGCDCDRGCSGLPAACGSVTAP